METVEVGVPHRQVEVVRSSQQACLDKVLQLLLPPRSPAQKQLVRMMSREDLSGPWAGGSNNNNNNNNLGQGGAVAHAIAVPEHGQLPLLLQEHWALARRTGN